MTTTRWSTSSSRSTSGTQHVEEPRCAARGAAGSQRQPEADARRPLATPASRSRAHVADTGQPVNRATVTTATTAAGGGVTTTSLGGSVGGVVSGTVVSGGFSVVGGGHLIVGGGGTYSVAYGTSYTGGHSGGVAPAAENARARPKRQRWPPPAIQPWHLLPPCVAGDENVARVDNPDWVLSRWHSCLLAQHVADPLRRVAGHRADPCEGPRGGRVSTRRERERLGAELERAAALFPGRAEQAAIRHERPSR